MPRPASIALALVLLAVLAVCGFALYIASTIARPHGNSLTEERRWEQDHGLWGDFESLERTACVAPGKDGYELHCELVSAPEPSDRYVIISHGFRANRYGAAKCVGAWESLGYNCIVYDLRAHGENAPATCTLGKVESEDLLTLVADARERFGEDITLGLMGESMGSATTLCALGSRPKVDFAVADCPFANLRELLRSGYDQARVGPLLPVVDAACRLRYGFELAETSPVSALAGNRVPLCLIHGEDDALIPPSNSERLRDATAGYVELHLVPGAGHAESREALGQEGYAQILSAFLSRAGV